MKLLKHLAVLALFFFTFSLKASPDEEARNRLKNLYGESKIYEEFFYKLKSALVSKNAEEVAKYNGYPIRVNFKAGTEYFKNSKDFLANYGRIITSEMLGRVEKQAFSTLFANSYGLHIGLGDIWFTGYCVGKNADNPCEKVKISVTAYNVNYVE
ncbi:MAG: hypothetical protein ABJK64_05570 [Paraglaciecola sp.]|uniref:hypothetical protein n=1 Tax=Paraglaciecola sp. TaxID=1920173 RepID=UPI003297D3A3